MSGIILNENVYTVYSLSLLTTTDFRILDGISKVLNEIIAFDNNNGKQTLWDEDIGPFQRRRTYRVETRGHDAILSYWFNTDEGDGGLVGRSCGGGRSASSPSSSSPTPCWIHQIAGTSVSFPRPAWSPRWRHFIISRETKRVRLGPIPVAFIYYILHDHDTYIPA